MVKRVAVEKARADERPLRLHDKAQLILAKVRELLSRIHRLEDKVQAQRAQISDLQDKIERLEGSRAEARGRLERIASQLPQR